jgi:hypothetical protein
VASFSRRRVASMRVRHFIRNEPQVGRWPEFRENSVWRRFKSTLAVSNRCSRIMQLAGGPAATQISDRQDGVNQTTLLHAERILLVGQLDALQRCHELRTDRIGDRRVHDALDQIPLLAIQRPARNTERCLHLIGVTAAPAVRGRRGCRARCRSRRLGYG